MTNKNDLTGFDMIQNSKGSSDAELKRSLKDLELIK